MDKWKKIKCLALDVDGVMTDGSIFLGENGEWRRLYYIRDGMGLVLLKKRGYKLAIITSSLAKDIQERARNLKIDYFFENVADKAEAFQTLLNKSQFAADEIAFMGDDVIDLPVFDRCGVSAAPQDAHESVRAKAQFVSSYPGGRGAVREICDMILLNGGMPGKDS
jgi:3-deoxy-D-manno-octulosonate 8-phosphate phosphatase (KDO 8-P phosphatase)